MTYWQLHALNARHGLTTVLPELRAAASHAVALASTHTRLPYFDLVVRAEPGGGIAQWGVAGAAPAPGVIEITIDPDRCHPDVLVRTLVHEMHHLIRWDGPGYGRTLGEALVSEGLAGHFVTQVLGGADPWDQSPVTSAVARRAVAEWARPTYDHPAWFFGRGDLRRWAGYGLGYRLIADYLAECPDQDSVTLAWAEADALRPTLRRLVAQPDPDAEDVGDAPDDDTVAATGGMDSVAGAGDGRGDTSASEPSAPATIGREEDGAPRSDALDGLASGEDTSPATNGGAAN